MSLPSVACFRQMDIIDQLTALYEAILQLSSGSFSPDQISGLLGWWKDEGMMNSGGDVTSWNDSSGNGGDLFPFLGPPTTYQAANLNGFPTVGFNASSDTDPSTLNLGSLLFTGTAGTIFMVVNKSSDLPGGGIYTLAAPQQPNQHPDLSDDVRDAFCSTTLKNCGEQIVPIENNWRIISIRSQDGNYQIEIDGQIQFSTNSNTFNSGSAFLLGAGEVAGEGFTSAFKGSLAEVIAYGNFLSDAQRDAVITYLRNRFDL